MDRYRAMAAFCRVAETGSFTKAADVLGVSRATVSVVVQQLEAHLGVRLLHRTTRQVSLTSDGEIYHRRARQILDQLEATEQLFRSDANRIHGRLTVDVPTRIARRVIIPALPEFLARHPKLEVQLGASDRSINLVETGVDAVVRVGRLRDSSNISKRLGQIAQVNCASPRYVARFGEPESLADLDRHVAVRYSPKLSAGSAAWRYVEDGEERSRPIASTVTVDNAESYIAACLAGLGLIQIPTYDVQHHLESGALVAVLSQHPVPSMPISILYPSRRQVPERLQTFTSWAQALFERRGMLEVDTGSRG